MLTLFIVVVLTLVLSASCSLFEAVLYSTRLPALEAAKKQDKHRKLAAIFLDMKKHVSAPIAGILILNTIANTAGASIAGMYVTTVFGSQWVLLFSLVFTLCILYFSEIIPKTVGVVYWRNLWPVVVYPLKMIKVALAPAIFVTQKLTSKLTESQKGKSITEEEILALVHLGAKEGEISHNESRIVQNIINLENIPIREIMTPRRVVFSLSADSTIQEAIRMVEESEFTRIPIYEGDRENIVGYIIRYDLQKVSSEEKSGTLVKALLKPITFIRDTTNCLTLLTSFLKHRRHIAVVLDEYGGVDGLVTLEDVLETALGREIVDEKDSVVDLQQSAREQKKLRARLDE